MIESNRKEFFDLIADVYAFYKRDFSKFAGNTWWRAMQPFDFEAVSDALSRHCVNPDSGQFMPHPADVMKMLLGSTMDSALVAWAKVDRAIRTVGTYRSVVFDDPLIHRVIAEMGGWVQLGAKSEDEWPFVRNELVNRYRGYRGRSQVPEYPPVLIGIAEAGNAKEGHRHAEPPVLIGAPADAQRVMQFGSNKPVLAITQMGYSAANAALQLVDARGAA